MRTWLRRVCASALLGGRELAPRVRRRVHQLILLGWATSVLMAVALVIGPWLNDRTIAADPGTAYATVTDSHWLRTTVDYRDEQGRVHSPRGGLLYHGSLPPGTGVWVTYSRTNPELVKVTGRDARWALLPAGCTFLGGSVLAVLAWWLVSLVGRRLKDKDRA